MANLNYLDSEGLLYLWQKIKARITAEVPTKVSELTNDSNFVSRGTTLAHYGINDAYTKSQTDSAIATAISSVKQMEFVIVQVLPASGDSNKIYLVPKTSTGTQDVYNEWIYVSNKWEHIGSTDIDLSDYLKSSDAEATYQKQMTAITNDEIDTIVAQ